MSTKVRSACSGRSPTERDDSQAEREELRTESSFFADATKTLEEGTKERDVDGVDVEEEEEEEKAEDDDTRGGGVKLRELRRSEVSLCSARVKTLRDAWNWTMLEGEDMRP